VSIDSSGQWWRGGTFDDIAEYVHEYTADGYSADQVRESVCATCGGKVFGLRGDQDAGAVRRTCRDCGKKAFIADSEESWPQSAPADAHAEGWTTASPSDLPCATAARSAGSPWPCDAPPAESSAPSLTGASTTPRALNCSTAAEVPGMRSQLCSGRAAMKYSRRHCEGWKKEAPIALG